MSWREQFKPGSFKGIPFYVDNHEFQGGRRIVDHIFPYRDTAWTEDLGRNQRIFNLDIYVLGDEYYQARDKLITAFESEGSGLLRHPYLGDKTVESVSFTLNESKSEGGIAYFSVTFHETERKPTVPVLDDIPKNLDIVSQKTDESLLKKFMEFDTQFINNADISALTAYVELANDVVTKALKFIPDGDLGIADLAYELQDTKNKTRSLILKPLRLATDIVDSLKLLVQMALGDWAITGQDVDRTMRIDRTKRDTVNENAARRAVLETVIRDYPRVSDDTPTEVYPSGQRLLENQKLLQMLYISSALTKLTKVAVMTEYGTYDEAISYRDFIISQAEEIMNDPMTSDDLFINMQELIVLAVQGIPGTFADNDKISKKVIVEDTPSIVLAYDLYEDMYLEDDIVMRNKVKNPAFVPAGEIEVLAGG